MQGVGEPDEEQEAGYPQQHLQLSALRASVAAGHRLVRLSPRG